MFVRFPQVYVFKALDAIFLEKKKLPYTGSNLYPPTMQPLLFQLGQFSPNSPQARPNGYLARSCKNLAKNGYLARSCKTMVILQDLARRMVILQDSCKTDGYLARFLRKKNWKKTKIYLRAKKKINQNCSANENSITLQQNWGFCFKLL